MHSPTRDANACFKLNNNNKAKTKPYVFSPSQGRRVFYYIVMVSPTWSSLLARPRGGPLLLKEGLASFLKTLSSGSRTSPRWCAGVAVTPMSRRVEQVTRFDLGGEKTTAEPI